LPGPTGNPHAQGRCGYGPRLPLLVISPFAKRNFVDHTTTDQSSIVRFIEDNWLSGERIAGSFDAIAGPIDNMFDFTWDKDGDNDRDRDKADRDRKLFLDPTTGEPVHRDGY
jgi:phospholipase C